MKLFLFIFAVAALLSMYNGQAGAAAADEFEESSNRTNQTTIDVTVVETDAKLSNESSEVLRNKRQDIQDDDIKGFKNETRIDDNGQDHTRNESIDNSRNTTHDKEDKNTEKRHAYESNDDNYGGEYVRQSYDNNQQQQQQQFQTAPVNQNYGGQSGQTGLVYEIDEEEAKLRQYERTIPGVPGRDYPILYAVPTTGFQCPGQPGLYGDIASRCQAWHFCQDGGRMDSFLCANGSLFNQQYLVCDWWYNVECETTRQFYGVNAQYAQLYGNRPGFGYNKGHERRPVTQRPPVTPPITTYRPVERTTPRSSAYPDQPNYEIPQVPRVFVTGSGSEKAGGYGQGAFNTINQNRGQGGPPGTYGQGMSSGSYNQGVSSGSYGQPGSSGNYGQSGSTVRAGQPGSSGSYGQSESSGSYGQSGLSGSYGQSGLSGSYGQAGSSGSYGQSATSGSYGKTGSSENYGQSGSSGSSGQAGSSINYGQSGSSGNFGQSGTSGSYGQSGTSGSSIQTGSSGSYGQSGSSGSSGKSGTSGSYGKAGSSGGYGQSGSSGGSGQSGASGSYGKAGLSGSYGQSGTSGSSVQAGSSGSYGQAGSSGSYGQAGSSGSYGQAGSSGSYGQAGSSGSYGQSGSSGTYEQRVTSGTYGIGRPESSRTSEQRVVSSGTYGQRESSAVASSTAKYAKGASPDTPYGQSGSSSSVHAKGGGSYEQVSSSDTGSYAKGGAASVNRQGSGKGGVYQQGAVSGSYAIGDASSGSDGAYGQQQGSSSSQANQSGARGQGTSSTTYAGGKGSFGYQNQARGEKTGQQQSNFKFGYQYSTGSQSGGQQTSNNYAQGQRAQGPDYPNPTAVTQQDGSYHYEYSNRNQGSQPNAPRVGNQYPNSASSTGANGAYEYSHSSSYPGGSSSVFQASYPRSGGTGVKSGYQYPPPDVKIDCGTNRSRCPPGVQTPRRVQPPAQYGPSSAQNVNTVYGGQDLAASGRVAGTSTTATTVSADDGLLKNPY